MQDDIVRSEKDGRKYRLGAYLQSGLLGVVYPGLAMDGSGKKVAVKLPAHNLGSEQPEQRERFLKEYEVLQALAGWFSAPPLPVPQMEEGTNLSAREEGRKQALIMEFVGEELLLSRQLPAADTKPWEREKMVLQAGLQYARLLVGLHATKYTCQDRKLTDLRWTPEHGGRLVVLDWNVVDDASGDKPREDIRLFGRLWYQLLSGRYAPANLDPLDDAYWREGAVSYGTRRLIVDTLAGRFQTAHELKAALDERWRWLEQPVAELVVEARRGYQELKQTWRDEKVMPLLAEEWRILDLFDLTVRRGSEDVEQERQDVLAHVQKQGERLIANLKQAFRIAKYDQGGPAGQQAQAIATQQNDSQLQLRVARWQLLIAAGEESIREYRQLMSSGHEGLHPIKDFLVKWVEDVEENVAQSAWLSHRWAQAEQLEQQLKEYFPADSRTLALLQNLIQEAHLWAAVAGVQQTQKQGDYKVAREQVEQITPLLQSIVSVGYRARVQAALPEDPARWQNTLAERAEEQLILESWNRDVQRFLDHLDRRNREIGGSPEGGEWLAQLRLLEDAVLVAETSPSDTESWLTVVKLALPLHYDPQLTGRLAGGPLYERLRERVRTHLKRVWEVVEQRQSKDAGFAYKLATKAWELEKAVRDGREKSIMANVAMEKTLFADLANRMSQLKSQSSVRGEIMNAITDGNWRHAMWLAKEHGIDLFLDPQFERQTAGYWNQVTGQAEDLRKQAEEAVSLAQEAENRLKQKEVWIAFARADQEILARDVIALERIVDEIEDQMGPDRGQWGGRLAELREELDWLRRLDGWPDDDLLADQRNSRFKALKANTAGGGFTHQNEVATLIRNLAESLKSGTMERFEEGVQKFQSFLTQVSLGEMERILYSDLLSAWQARADRRQLLLDEIAAAQQFLNPLEQIKQQSKQEQLFYLRDILKQQGQLLRQVTEAPAELSFCQGKQKTLGEEIQECLDQTIKFMKTLDVHLYGEGRSHGAWLDNYLKDKKRELVSRSEQGEKFFQVYSPRTSNQQGRHVSGRSQLQRESQHQSRAQQPQARSASTQMHESPTSPFAAPSPQGRSPMISGSVRRQSELNSSMEATGKVASIHMKTNEPLDVRSGGEKTITVELRDESGRLATSSHQVTMALEDSKFGGLWARDQGPQGPPRPTVTFQVKQGRQEVIYRAPHTPPLDGAGEPLTVIIRAKVDNHETELKLLLKPGLL